MSHLHIPDGVLPALLWVPGLLIMFVLLFWSARATRARGPQLVAFQSALGGIMLAVMALPVPITAFDYCMTLAGPIGVLLGVAPAFQVSFVVTLILALLGQGGFTVVGLNTLVLALGAVLARPIYLWSVAAIGPARAMAVATAVSQLASTVCWGVLLWASVVLTPDVAGEHEVQHTMIQVWHRAGTLVIVPLLLLAVALESLLGYGLAHFLQRVRPDILPAVPGAPVAAVAPVGPGRGAH